MFFVGKPIFLKTIYFAAPRIKFFGGGSKIGETVPVHPCPPVLLVSLLPGVNLHDEAGVGLGVVRQEGRRVDLVRVGDVPQGLVAVGLAVVSQAVDVLIFVER